MDVIHDKQRNKFVIFLGSDKAYLRYDSISDEIIDMWHTEVPEQFRGQGIGKHLAKAAFDYAVQHNLKMKLTCTFLQKYLHEHPKEEYFARVIAL